MTHWILKQIVNQQRQLFCESRLILLHTLLFITVLHLSNFALLYFFPHTYRLLKAVKARAHQNLTVS